MSARRHRTLWLAHAFAVVLVVAVAGPAAASAAGLRRETVAASEIAPAAPGDVRGLSGTIEDVPRGPDIPASSVAGHASSVAAVDARFPGLSGSDEPSDGSIAVGPNHVMEAVNSSVRIFSRQGAPLFSATLADFLGFPGSRMSDPRTYFDALGGHWYVLAFDQDQIARTNRFHLSISRSADPTQGFCEFDKDQSVYGGQTGAVSGDFPGLGMDDYALYVTQVRFGFASARPVDTRIEMFPRSGLNCQQQSLSPTVWTVNLTAPDGAALWEVQPATAFGVSGTGYLAGTESGGGQYVGVVQLSHTATPQLSTRWIGVSPYQPHGAGRQLGSAVTIDFSDTRVPTSPVYRDGSLWVTHTALATAAPHTAIRWYEITTASMSVAQRGEIWNSAVDWGYPAVMADSQHNLTIVAAYADPAAYVGANVLTKMATESTFAQGQSFGASGAAPYLAVDPTRGLARWGDYFGIALDPDGQHVWVEASYPTTSFGWSTSIAMVRSGASSAPPTAQPTLPPQPTPPPAVMPPPPVACSASVGPGIPPPPSIASGIDGFHAAWYGQSGYPTLCPGQQSTATVAFVNTGSRGWVLGRAGEAAFLGTAGPEPGQDRPSPLGGDGTTGSPNTGWPSYNRVAIQPAPYVGPGQVAWFQFTVVAPQAPGTYRLGLRPLIEGTQWLEDYGVFWYVIVKAATGGPIPTPGPGAPLSITPPSASVAVGGLQQFTASGGPAGASVTWSVIGGCGAITGAGLFAATATTSAGQPCYVIATAGGFSVSAPIAVTGGTSPTPSPTRITGATVTTRQTSFSPSEGVTVDWTNPPAAVGDYVTFARQDTGTYDWIWTLEPSAIGEVTLRPAGLAPGIYQLRLYTVANSLLAVGPYVTVK